MQTLVPIRRIHRRGGNIEINIKRIQPEAAPVVGGIVAARLDARVQPTERQMPVIAFCAPPAVSELPAGSEGGVLPEFAAAPEQAAMLIANAIHKQILIHCFSFFISSSPLLMMIRTAGFYALIAPTMTPFAKCFCKNGNTHIMGSDVSMTAPILIPISKLRTAACAELLLEMFDSITMERSAT